MGLGDRAHKLESLRSSNPTNRVVLGLVLVAPRTSVGSRFIPDMACKGMEAPRFSDGEEVTRSMPRELQEAVLAMLCEPCSARGLAVLEAAGPLATSGERRNQKMTSAVLTSIPKTFKINTKGVISDEHKN